MHLTVKNNTFDHVNHLEFHECDEEAFLGMKCSSLVVLQSQNKTMYGLFVTSCVFAMMKWGLWAAIVIAEEMSGSFSADYNREISKSRDRQETDIFQADFPRPEKRNISSHPQ